MSADVQPLPHDGGDDAHRALRVDGADCLGRAGGRGRAGRPGGAGDRPERQDVLRVATWNVHRCIGTDRRRDPARVAALLREIDADVVALQEVDTHRIEPSGEPQAAYLARSIGAELVLGITCRVDGGTCEFGNAILARGEVLNAVQLDLSRGRREPRGALLVQIGFGARRVRTLTTHLGLRAAERRTQVARLLQVLRGHHGAAGGPRMGRRTLAGGPHATDLEHVAGASRGSDVASDTDAARHTAAADAAGAAGADVQLLMGDFNEWLPGNRNLRRVHRQFGQTPAPRTYPSWWPVLALDRIWVAPRAALRALWVHSEPAARVASDHLPVVGEIVWSTCPDQAPS